MPLLILLIADYGKKRCSPGEKSLPRSPQAVLIGTVNVEGMTVFLSHLSVLRRTKLAVRRVATNVCHIRIFAYVKLYYLSL